MSESEDYFEEEHSIEGKNPLRKHVKQLEQEVAELRRERAEAAAAKKELAFAKSGIPLDAPMAKYFIKGYEGELEPDAIRQAALEAGLMQAPPDGSAQEAAAWKRTQQVAAGSNVSEPPVDYVTRINNAKRQAEVEQILLEAAQAAEI
jgi:hypothetical protein